VVICAAACITTHLRVLGRGPLLAHVESRNILLTNPTDVSGNKVLEGAKAARDCDPSKAHAQASKSKAAEEARALIVCMRDAAVCTQLEQLGCALGLFLTLKNQFEGDRGQLKMQSILQIRHAHESWIQAARDCFWKGLLAAVSGRACTASDIDLTANSLDRADEDAVMAILNKLAVDGVAGFSLGHAFLKYSSIAVRMVASVTASCATNCLQYLNLTGTLVANEGAVVLSRALGRNSLAWPQELNLSKCNISDAGCIALIDALLQFLRRNATSIGAVNLSQNSITDEAMAAITPMLGQIVELLVSAWANFVTHTSLGMQGGNLSQLQGSRNVPLELTDSCFSIQELNFECNIVSDVGLRHLISSFVCKSILKHRAAALSSLLQQKRIPLTTIAELFASIDLKPVLKILRIGGNVCRAAAGGSIVHVCRSDPVFALECSSVFEKPLPAPQYDEVGRNSETSILCKLYCRNAYSALC
jgi:hypothetical protein